MFELKGIAGKFVSIEGNSVLINNGKFLIGTAKEHSIPITNIIGVFIKKPGLQAGLIRFQTAGKMDDNIYRDDVAEAIKDKNAILFHGKDKYEIALKIKSYIENYSNEVDKKNSHISSLADEIAKLKRLLDDKIINQDEFESAKEKLINI